MSWLSSWWSPSARPSPASSQQSTHEKRILEEPQKPATATPAAPSTIESPTRHAPKSREFDNPNRNKVIFGAGVAFFALGVLISRRAVARRRLAAQFYANAPAHNAEAASRVSAPMEAVEALNIATVNVLSLTMMATGGTLWYLDINSMAEARRFIRGGLGVDGTGRSEKEAEEDFEEWMATTLARKDAKTPKQAEAEIKK